jgi:plastocyanin
MTLPWNTPPQPVAVTVLTAQLAGCHAKRPSTTPRHHLILVLATQLVLGAPGVAAQESPTTVRVSDNAFFPAEIVVPAGTTVAWTNNGSLHNVVGADGLWDSGLLVRPATYQRHFDTPGRYRYACTLHSGMNGTVLVLAPGETPPPPPPTRAGSRPRLHIVEPADGTVLPREPVRVRVQVEDFALGLANAADEPGGYWQLLVDGARLQTLTVEEAILPPLPPGAHTLEAHLRQPDLARVEGAAPARATFTLLAPAEPAPQGTAWPWLALGALALLAGGGALLARRPGRHPRQRRQSGPGRG